MTISGSLIGLWGLFLTGILSELTGSPGALQAIRLRNLLEYKKDQLETSEVHLAQLRKQKDDLSFNTTFQEREIRRVLGYAAHDELIFDFNSSGHSEEGGVDVQK